MVTSHVKLNISLNCLPDLWREKQLPKILDKHYSNQLAITFPWHIARVCFQNKHVFQNKREVNFKLWIKMKTLEENVLRPELKYTNWSCISLICLAKTILCLILVLFFSEDQFLDIFHEELEGRTRKKIECRVICLWYDNVHDYYFIWKHHIQLFTVLNGEDHKWLFLLESSSKPFS